MNRSETHTANINALASEMDQTRVFSIETAVPEIVRWTNSVGSFSDGAYYDLGDWMEQAERVIGLS